jgi:hypothetical protein
MVATYNQRFETFVRDFDTYRTGYLKRVYCGQIGVDTPKSESGGRRSTDSSIWVNVTEACSSAFQFRLCGTENVAVASWSCAVSTPSVIPGERRLRLEIEQVNIHMQNMYTSESTLS